MTMAELDEAAGIQYLGDAGISVSCKEAVMGLLLVAEPPSRVKILTNSQTHCLLFAIGKYDAIAVKSGFSSGYLGTGPSTFSFTLQLLESHGIEVEEYEVDKDFITRLDDSALTRNDIEGLENQHPVRPSRWWDYIHEIHQERGKNGELWKSFPAVIPFKIIDKRIVDLAITFWKAPDERLLSGYRRLEDIVRRRTKIDEIGTKLFSQAFQGPTSKLEWKGIDPGEQTGRAQIFTGIFQAHRNPRAYREPNDQNENLLSEFLLLNHLFLLEGTATERL